MRILLIEDDEVLADILSRSLHKQNYVVDIVADGETGWEYVESTKYDLLLMDVGLPKLDGITLCQQLRSKGFLTPILLMTAKDASSDRIRGLDAGADDYLIKPFEVGELQARVRALLRRGDVPRTPVLQVGALRLDPSICEAKYEDKPLELTPKEYSLLELFLRNPARVYSRGDIIEHLWTFDDPPQEESVKSHIKGLRQKLKAAGASDWIENVYGVGYRLKSHSQEKSQISNSPTKIFNPNVEQQFNQAMSGMWNQYQELMAERIQVLQQAAGELHTGKLGSDLHQSAGRAAHKLAGVLGMFGKETGTQTAREIERILEGDSKLSAAQQRQLISLIEKLDNLLNLKKQGKEDKGTSGQRVEGVIRVNSSPSSPSPLSAPLPPLPDARLLLIDPDLQLGAQLQKLVQTGDIYWKQITKLEDAKHYLQNTSPDLVVLSIDEAGWREESLALLLDLANRTPPLAVLVLAAVDGLVDRVTVARAGARGFLAKPATATQIWNTALQILQRSRSQVINVLVVDDDPVMLEILRPMLEPWGIRMTELEDPLHFWEVLQAVMPDLLILDVNMPQLSGIELCQAVRTDPNWQELPILFLTAHREMETVQQVFAAGADDYVVKPVVGAELLARITHRLERARLLQAFYTKDLITGVANQPQSDRDLQQFIIHAQTHSQLVCLAIFSVADLRQINIQYGHEAGNQVLQKWGRLFQSTFRGGEVVGYWGNGEFVVGISGLTKAEMSDRLSDVLTTLRQQIFIAADGTRYQAICNFAVVEYPTDGLNVASLYQAASSILEISKNE
ncbi:response regulator [Chlorogloeopsis sp. ULAP01]|uniref:response regulator n=1 Tax=Chlorogloeopsis sp. ULAP01 TaxID=3056483 RepID=UPI0025AB3DC2|nr:response regulator [Chlorogloeopsis sp. ULAP01]MDM9383726.1 response regulator [Chlorogloeopsis sp. ULAP01]